MHPEYFHHKERDVLLESLSNKTSAIIRSAPAVQVGENSSKPHAVIAYIDSVLIQAHTVHAPPDDINVIVHELFYNL